MIPFHADLHCHSQYSDGTLSPEELMQLAHQNQLQGISITDHDTVGSYPQAFAIAGKYNIACVSGVEFSTIYADTSIHILGYAFIVDHPAITSLCQLHISRRQGRNQAILDRLEQLKMPIDLPICRATHSIGRPHIAEAMVKKGYVRNIQEAFNKYLGEGRPCYVSGEPFSVEQTIETIHQAQGFAILAHPHLIQEAIIPELLKLPFDGLEGYYACFSSKKNERWIKIAKQHNWMITGGSDFHGSIKPEISLGCAGTPEATFHLLHARSIRNNRPLAKPALAGKIDDF
jgi:predicted metal-dependent phosphoesterase TrpH